MILYLFMYILHFDIECGYLFGTLPKLRRNITGIIDTLFISQLVLKARPKVHGNRSELHLYSHVLGPVCEKNRNFHYQMKTAVSAWLRISDIVLHRNELDIVLFEKHFAELIYIIRKRAYYANAGNIAYVITYRLKRVWERVAF